MNIFFLDKDPVKCAEFHNDKHVVKMRTELCQIFSTNYSLLGGTNAPYRITHKNHPCTIWARESIDNALWAFKLLVALEREYQYRYGPKPTKCSELIKLIPDWLETVFSRLSTGGTQPALAMPEQYRSDDPVKSYREYYVKEKVHMLNGKRMDVWTKRNKPYWWRDNE